MAEREPGPDKSTQMFSKCHAEIIFVFHILNDVSLAKRVRQGCHGFAKNGSGTAACP
jgi:hypothetical protein